MTTTSSHGRAGAVENRSGQWLEQMRAFTWRYLRELLRDRTVLFWTLGFPAGFYLLTVSVFVPEIPARAEPYVLASIAVSYGTFGALIAALNSFSEQLGSDIEDDRYVLFRSLSIAPSADLAGRLLAGTGLAAVAMAAVVPVGVVTGANFGLRSALSPLVVAVAVVTFAVVWMTVAVLVTVAVRNTRYASIVTVSLALVAFMLSGYNGTDPSFFQGPDVLLNWLPHTLATRLLAHHLVVPPAGVDAGLAPPAIPSAAFGTAVLTGYAVISLVVAVSTVRRVLYKREVMP
ncbi:ABC transporter permease [Halopiger goleimassiliensis]|uniref:ABC transporter permease n=1 Tax=Halopiger goleimassiliensis TaxID=1293048 RepID=UPI0012B59CBF|nr:ABC transporter permease [Halopiger goleimassiliensis]